MRESTIQRRTKETEIDIALRIEGTGQVEAETGIGMLDHMVEQLARHGGFGPEIEGEG